MKPNSRQLVIPLAFWCLVVGLSPVLAAEEQPPARPRLGGSAPT
jgi:hypothetical protein